MREGAVGCFFVIPLMWITNVTKGALGEGGRIIAESECVRWKIVYDHISVVVI